MADWTSGYAAPFRNPEDLQDYLLGVDGGEGIICLICGRSLRALGVHVRHAHGLSADGYCAEFGIPVTYGLVAPSLSEHLSLAAKACMDSNQGRKKMLCDGLVVARKMITREDQNKLSPATCEQLRRRSRSMTQDPPSGHILNLNSETVCISSTCNSCGKPFNRTTNQSAARQINWGECLRCAQIRRDRARPKRPGKKWSSLTQEQRERSNELHKLAKRAIREKLREKKRTAGSNP